jgi:hypothetical protein
MTRTPILSTISVEVREDSPERLLVEAELVAGRTLSGSSMVFGAGLAGSVAGAILLGPVGLLAGLGTAAGMAVFARLGRRAPAAQRVQIELRAPGGSAYREQHGSLRVGDQRIPLSDIVSIRVFNEEAPLGPLWTLTVTLKEQQTVEVVPRYRAPWDRIEPAAKALARHLGIELNA